MEKSKLVVMPNGSLRNIQINGWYIPIDGVKSQSTGCHGNSNWIYDDEINFCVVKNWMEDYRPLANCKLL